MEHIPRCTEKYLLENGFSKTGILIINCLLQKKLWTLKELAFALNKSVGALDSTLKKLTNKKIIERQFINNSQTYFIPSVSNLLNLTEAASQHQIDCIKNNQENFSRFLKNLVLLSLRPKIRFFDGINGIKQSYEMMLEEAKGQKEILGYFSVVEKQQPELQRYFTEMYVPKRVSLNIYARNIAVKSPKTLYYKLTAKRDLRKIRLLSDNYFPTVNSEINLFGNFLHCMSFNDDGGFALILKDEDGYMISILKSSFELAWKAAEEEDKKINEQLATVKNADTVTKWF